MNLKSDSFNLIRLLSLTFLTCLFFWLIFYFNLPRFLGFPVVSLETIYQNYDGPNYLAISKCGYKFECLAKSFALPLPLEYYPAHLPGYPALIKFFDFFTTGPKAMLLATLSGSLFLTYAFYQFLRLFIKPEKSFWLSVIFLFLPARFLVLRLVGAPETWFVGLTLASITAFKTKKYFLSAVFATLAQLLKSPGIILFAVYAFVLLKQNNLKKILPYFLIPITGFLIFYLYYLQTGDFFAYFNSGDNHHLTLLPFSVFVSNQSWIYTIWLEELVYIFILVFLGLKFLYKKFKVDIIFLYPLLFTLATIMVAHRDISRYISPVYPFIILAFHKAILKNKFILLLIVPAVFLYAINFIIGNTIAISNWAPYL